MDVAQTLLKRPRMLGGIALAGLVLTWWMWSGDGSAAIPHEMAMSSEQLAAMPDPVLVRKVLTELRFKLQADPARIARWRKQPDPVRHLLALSSVEQRFTGFAELFSPQRPDPYRIQVEDLALAYDAIGAGGITEILEAAARLAEAEPDSSPGQPGPFAELDARFVEQRLKADVQLLLRTYIRENSEEIAKHM